MNDLYIPGLCCDDTYYGVYRTNLFRDIFPSVDTFNTEYANVGLGGIDSDDLRAKVYKLLFAKYANDAVYSSDEGRFIYEVFSIIFKYGPEFEKTYEIQSTIKNMSEDELREGTRAIHNHAMNPSTIPQTQEFEQLKKIDEQTATGYKRNKLEALMMQSEGLDSKYIDTFINRFAKLFSPFPAGRPLVYEV